MDKCQCGDKASFSIKGKGYCPRCVKRFRLHRKKACKGCGKPATKNINDIPVCDECYELDRSANKEVVKAGKKILLNKLIGQQKEAAKC